MVVCVVSLAVLAIGIFRTRGLTDDGLIHLRVVQQFRSGHGLIFNAGERVEVSSSPLWVVLLAISDLLLPMRLEAVTLLVSGVLAFAGVAIVMRSAFQDAAATGRRVLPGLMIVYALLPAVWRWSTTGMENALIMAWLGGCWYLARRALRTRSLDAAYALLIGFGPLIRQDYVLACVLLVLAALWSARPNLGRRSALGFIAIAATPALIYQLFRMIYFGLVVPNPTVAKYLGSPRWSRGWTWLTRALLGEGPAWAIWMLIVLVVASVLLAAKSERVTSAAFVAAGLMMALPAVAAGGDFMDVRFLVPALFALILPASMIVVPKRFPGAEAASATAADVPPRRSISGRVGPINKVRLATASAWVATAMACSLVVTHGFWEPAPEVFMTASLRRVTELAGLIDLDSGRSVDDNPAAYFLLKRQEDIVMQRQTYVSIGIGGISAYRPLEDRIYDQLGLANPIGSHMMPKHPSKTGLPGHEKPLPAAWVIADLGLPRLPRVTAAIPVTDPRKLSKVPETEWAETAIDTAAADRAMKCDPMVDLREAATAPLTFSRAWKNFTGAWSRTWLTFDPDPQVAEREMCGKRR